MKTGLILRRGGWALVAYAMVCVLFCAGCAPASQGTEVDVAAGAVLGVATDAPTEAEPTPEPTPYIPPKYFVEGAFVVECNSYINMRAEASTTAELAGGLDRGERVEVLEYVGRYAKVRVMETGKEGYVIAGYLRPEADVWEAEIVQLAERYTYDDLLSDIEALVQRYPQLIQTGSIGKSVRGREIPVLTLGNTDAQHHVLLQAQLSGRDFLSSLLTMALVERSAQNGGYADVCVHVIPMANPDGAQLCQSEKFPENIWEIYSNDYGMELTGFQGTEYLLNWRANANGVDLGLNFPLGWRKGRASQPSFSGYSGKSAQSEPESKALVAYVQNGDFDGIVSLGATGSQLL